MKEYNESEYNSLREELIKQIEIRGAVKKTV